MTRAGFDANKIFVIYNSLDYEVQKEYFENLARPLPIRRNYIALQYFVKLYNIM